MTLASRRTAVTDAPTLSPQTHQATPRATQMVALAIVAPPQTKFTRVSDEASLAVRVAGHNVTTRVTEAPTLIVYKASPPALPRQTCWTFDLDGHKFYVLPLGQEGDWAYDFSTKQWCQLQTQGFNGLNFVQGVMWGLRIMGGDSLYNNLYELDPNQPLDEAWRSVQHIVTGGLSTRGRNMIGCASFTITASPADIQQAGAIIALSFSDDQGQTWVGPFNETLTGKPNQLLTWSALGSFAQPGRIFQISDQAGVVRIDGADAALQNYNEDEQKG
jgi:hypothetical protein